MSAELQCDCCQSAMLLNRFASGGGEFSCTQCDQQVEFHPDGRIRSVILAALYPSNMKRGSAIYRQWLNHKLAEWDFQISGQELCGLLSREEADGKRREARSVVDKEISEIDAERPWWQFWKAA